MTTADPSDAESEISTEQLVEAYWRHFGLSTGDRADRKAADRLHWAWERVRELAVGEHGEALSTLVALADGAPAAPGVDLMDDARLLRCLSYLGAGPLESFIETHEESAVDDFDKAARLNERFCVALRCVWFDGHLSATSAERLRRFGEPL